MSYGAFSSLNARPEGGLLRGVVQTRNESAAKVLRLVQGELDRLIATPVGDAEPAALKASLIATSAAVSRPRRDSAARSNR